MKTLTIERQKIATLEQEYKLFCSCQQIWDYFSLKYSLDIESMVSYKFIMNVSIIPSGLARKSYIN